MKISRKLANNVSDRLGFNDEQRAQFIAKYCYTIEEIKQLVYYTFCSDYGQHNIEGAGLLEKDLYDIYLLHNSKDKKELEKSENFESDSEPKLHNTEIKFYYITDTDMKDFELIERKLIEGVQIFDAKDYRNSLINP